LVEHSKWVQISKPRAKIRKATAEYKLVTEKALQDIAEGDSQISLAAAQLLYSGGKRIRPIITLLSCEAISGSYQKAVPIAVAYELAHSASLIQDDVIDNSSMRRNQPTLQSKYGVTGAMLVSDYLLFCIFSQLSKYDDLDITKNELAMLLQYLGEAARLAVIGEASKSGKIGSKGASEDEYLEVIGQKTAALFAAPAASGAIVAGAEKRVVDAMYRFGYYFGLAYQITDDILDIVGSERDRGKPTFIDLRNRSINIVVIDALAKSDAKQRSQIRSTEGWATRSGRKKMIATLEDLGAIKYAETLAKRYGSLSRDRLGSLPPSGARDKLEDLTRTVLIS
jgi:geranylgeranyl pyrophosphate synthase